MSKALDSQQPGYFEFHKGPPGCGINMVYNCPCGCGTTGSIRVYSKKEKKPEIVAWQWDGNRQTPTLKPSIRRLIDCKFHGYLTAGVWSTCKDGAGLSKDIYRGT